MVRPCGGRHSAPCWLNGSGRNSRIEASASNSITTVNVLPVTWLGQEDSPDGSLTEVTVCMSVTELDLDTTGRRLAITKQAGEARRTGVRFTATIRVRTVVTLPVNTGTRCKHTREPHLRVRPTAAGPRHRCTYFCHSLVHICWRTSSTDSENL